MSKLQANLVQEMKLHPQKEFKVIITLKEGYKPESLSIANYQALMDTLLSAGLTAAQLQKLAQNEGVEAIELDAEMGMM